MSNSVLSSSSLSNSGQMCRQVFFVYNEKEILSILHSRAPFKAHALIVSNQVNFSGQTLINEYGFNIISPIETNQYLGTEINCLIYDATHDFNVNAFTAISGSLTGGNPLFLVLPKALKESINRHKQIRQSDKAISPTLIRFINKIFELSGNNLSNIGTKGNSFENRVTNFKFSNEFIEQQNELIHKITRCALGHAKRPLVITAGRGRGKSTAIGIAVARLAFHNNKKIIVTSPRRENIEILYQHFETEINRLALHEDKNKSKYLQGIKVLPPDKLISNKIDCDLLVVEEAGAIPVQQLIKICDLHNRIVYSTTTDGYEGNGQGFEVRFKKHLLKRYPQARFCQLIYPARWAINDPLEEAINGAFLLLSNGNAYKQSSNEHIDSFINIDSLEFRVVEQNNLKNDELLLADIYQLLVIAHYQTRPSDLERMLSDPNIKIFIAMHSNQVVATALIMREGSLSNDLYKQIAQGKHRLTGNLLPQSLMNYRGIAEAGKPSYWRIMRIAVYSTLQNQNIGSQLVSYITNKASASGIDLVGTSFALDSTIANFWYKQSFLCVRISTSRDSSTGNHTSDFLRYTNSSSDNAKTIYHTATKLFNQSLLYSISSAYRHLDVEVVTQIIKYQYNDCAHQQSINNFRQSEIQQYIAKRRSFEMLEWEIFNFVKSKLFSLKEHSVLNAQQELILVAKIFQQKEWSELIDIFELTGKKQAKEAVRTAVENLYTTALTQ